MGNTMGRMRKRRTWRTWRETQVHVTVASVKIVVVAKGNYLDQFIFLLKATSYLSIDHPNLFDHIESQSSSTLPLTPCVLLSILPRHHLHHLHYHHTLALLLLILLLLSHRLHAITTLPRHLELINILCFLVYAKKSSKSFSKVYYRNNERYVMIRYDK